MASEDPEPEAVPVFRRFPPLPAGGGTSGGTAAVPTFARDRRAPKAGGGAPPPLLSHQCYGNLGFNGRLCVPVEDTPAFARACVADFAAGNFYAFTENRPRLPDGRECASRMYFDYDIETVDGRPPSETMFRRLEWLEKRVLARFLPSLPEDSPVFTSVVCASGVRTAAPKAAGAPPVYAAGVHVYYPHLYLTLVEALYVCTAVQSAAKAQLAEYATPDQWAQGGDLNVYGESRGLRWVWQLKDQACPACAPAAAARTRARSGGACDTCDGAGRVPDLASSMYSPIYRVDGRGVRTPVSPDPRLRPTVDLMLECSLRAHYMLESTPGFVVYPGAEPVPKVRALTGAAAGVLKESGLEEGAKAVAAAAAVLRRLDPHWSRLQVDRLTQHVSDKGRRRTYFKAAVSGEGSGYCANYGKDHRSARVYFILKPEGVLQRCYCRCPDVRLAGGTTCRKYESDLFPFLRTDPKLDFAAPPPTEAAAVVYVQAAAAPAPASPTAPATPAPAAPTALAPDTAAALYFHGLGATLQARKGTKHWATAVFGRAATAGKYHQPPG